MNVLLCGFIREHSGWGNRIWEEAEEIKTRLWMKERPRTSLCVGNKMETFSTWLAKELLFCINCNYSQSSRRKEPEPQRKNSLLTGRNLERYQAHMGGPSSNEKVDTGGEGRGMHVICAPAVRSGSRGTKTQRQRRLMTSRPVMKPQLCSGGETVE